jgi:hypothetical protein
MQIDNEPCPGHIRITTESARGCPSRGECKVKIEKFYTFENHGTRMFEKDRDKARLLKERKERKKAAEEERARQLAQRQERDLAFFKEKRKKKLKLKKEKFEEAEREVYL